MVNPPILIGLSSKGYDKLRNFLLDCEDISSDEMEEILNLVEVI
jgi:hypothetical protein